MPLVQDTTGSDKLKSYVERMENLLDEIEGLKDDLKDLKAQARDDGFNVLALAKLVSIRRNKRSASRETELLNDLVLYAHATGTPLDFVFAEDDLGTSPPGGATSREHQETDHGEPATVTAAGERS